MRWTAFVWAGACLLALVLATPASAQTRVKPTAPPGSGTGTISGPTTPEQSTPPTQGTGGFGFGFFGNSGLLGGLVQLTPQQELELMMQALETVEMLVTLLAVEDERSVLFLFLFVYELYRFQAILDTLTAGTTDGS